MNAQLNLIEGEKLKKRGMERAAAHQNELLRNARTLMVFIAMSRQNKCVTADDWNGISLGNAAGSLFKGEKWEFTGQWVKSKRVSRHAGMIRVWRLR